MGNFWTGILMSFSFLIFMIIRKRKYEISTKLLIGIHILFTITGTFGASLGAFLSGLMWSGKRLHLLMVVDTITLLIFCRIFKKDDKIIGDYLSIPVIAVCVASKIGCLSSGCCKGIVLFTNDMGNLVRFPSPAFELAGWVSLMIYLYIIEKKGRANGMLWPIALIWFGVFRCLVDFLRESYASSARVFLNLPGGQAFSLLALLCGVTYLFSTLKKINGKTPNSKEFIYAMVGLSKISIK